MERESIIFYKSWADATLHLPAQERSEILTAIIDYAVYGKKPDELSVVARSLFTVVKPLIDTNNKRYIGSKRGGSKKGVSNNPFGRAGKTKELPMVDNQELPMVDNLEKEKTTYDSSLGTKKELPNVKCNTLNAKCNTLNAKCNTLNELSNDNNLSIRQANASSNRRQFDEADAEHLKQNLERLKLVDEVVAYYNSCINEAGAKLRKCDTLSDKRKTAILSRIDEHGIEKVRRMIDKAVASRFLNYDANGAPMSIDWLMRPNNFPKVVDGNYDNKERTARNGNNKSMSEDRYIGMIHTEGENDPSVWEREKELAKKYKR